MKIPEVLCIEIEHAPGNLARMLAVVGDAGLTVDGLEQISRTQNRTRWELTLEIDEEQDRSFFDAIDQLPFASLVGRSDRVFTRHEGGKIATVARETINSVRMLRDVYTPGVARVCLEIQKDETLARRYTSRHRTVAIVTNGTAILGLGDIGAVAGLPVMEGEAALFHQLAELSGVPILIEEHDASKIVEAVAAVAPSFGAIQLEDIRAPECFEIEAQLQERLSIPVLHDDQHGTAVVACAALLTGARRVGRPLEGTVIGQVGLGAAGIGIGHLLRELGVGRLLGADLDPAAVARFEALGGEGSDLAGVMAEADVIIATTGVRDLIRPEMVRAGQLIFALSNPEPEIAPQVALERGAAFAADGRNSHNVLGFPGLFRGALEAGATRFTPAMLLAAARAISDAAPEDMLVPNPLDLEVHAAVTRAVREAASS